MDLNHLAPCILINQYGANRPSHRLGKVRLCIQRERLGIEVERYLFHHSHSSRPTEHSNLKHTSLPERRTDEDRRLIPSMLFQSPQQAGFLTAAPSTCTGATWM